MLFEDRFQIISLIGSTSLLSILPEYLSILVVFSRCHLKTEEEFSSKSCPSSRRFVILAWCHPLIIILDCENSFHPSDAFHEFLSFLDHLKAIIYSFSACSYRSPNLTGASFKYPLISSWSLRSHGSKSPQVSSFVFQLFPVNCAFATFILNSYGGSFKISLPSLSYQIFVLLIPPVVPSIPSQICAISLLILSTRISNMQNPLIAINLIWWRISIQSILFLFSQSE